MQKIIDSTIRNEENTIHTDTLTQDPDIQIHSEYITPLSQQINHNNHTLFRRLPYTANREKYLNNRIKQLNHDFKENNIIIIPALYTLNTERIFNNKSTIPADLASNLIYIYT